MAKSKKPINSKGQRHGYWERYRNNGRLYYKGHYKNGQLTGLFVRYFDSGEIWDKEYYNHNGNGEGIGLDGLNVR